MRPKLRIVSRSSPLALAQTQAFVEAASALADCEIITTSTLADDDQNSALHQLGGKGAFSGTLETALLDHKADVAVHSLKDLGVLMPSSLCLAGVSERASVADALIFPDSFKKQPSWDHLPKGAKIGTCSLRRQGLIRQQREDLNPVQCRGNLATRLAKLDRGDFDAIILARCGIMRQGLALDQRILSLEAPTWTPAAGAAIIGYQCRTADAQTQQIIRQISCPTTFQIAKLERAIVNALGASCHWPLAVYADHNPKPMVTLHISVPAYNKATPRWHWQTQLKLDDWPMLMDTIMSNITQAGIMQALSAWPQPIGD